MTVIIQLTTVQEQKILQQNSCPKSYLQQHLPAVKIVTVSPSILKKSTQRIKQKNEIDTFFEDLNEEIDCFFES